MLIAKDKNGNKAEIKYHSSPDRKESYLITFLFAKGGAQTNWALDEKSAKALVVQVLGKVEWEVKDENRPANKPSD
jgi:hypothetical protein